MRRLVTLAAISALVVAMLVAVVGTRAANATDTSGFTPTTVTDSVIAYANLGNSPLARCPNGQTPIAGGIWTPNGSNVVRYREYVDYGSGFGVSEQLHNLGNTDVSVTAYARCVDINRLVTTTRVVATFPVNNTTHHAGGYTTCPDGSYALTARTDWNNQLDPQSIDFTGPSWDLRSWLVAGTNTVSNNYMTVDLQCVAATSFPGAYLVHSQWENTTSSNSMHYLTATCPSGMTLLNGGTFTQRNGDSSDFSVGLGTTYLSYPDGDTWYAQALVPAHTSTSDYIQYVTAWCLPNQKPTLTIYSAPQLATNNPVAQFGFTASDPAAIGGYGFSYTCSIDGAAPVGCSSPWSTTVAEGAHYLKVTAITGDGRANSANYNWIYDKTAPTIVMRAMAAFTLASSVNAAWTGTDTLSGIASYNVRDKVASYSSTFGGYRRPPAWQQLTGTSVKVVLAQGSTYCMSVQALDKASNASAYSADRCTARPVDDADLTASSGWTPVADTHYWNHTYSTTSSHNATLTLAAVHLDRVGIVAQTCPTCGQVAVLVGGTQIGTIDLFAAATHRKVILPLPKFSALVGDVVIKVISTGKIVQIDGLATSQA